jgi:hypothetical protein
MCVPGLSRLAQISLTKAFHRSSVETRMIGKTKTKTTKTVTLNQNVVLNNFNQILTLHLVYTCSPSFFPFEFIELIVTYSYTIQTSEYHYQGSFPRKDDNHRHARSSRVDVYRTCSNGGFKQSGVDATHMNAKVYNTS